jgi:hypothetical protein
MSASEGRAAASRFVRRPRLIVPGRSRGACSFVACRAGPTRSVAVSPPGSLCLVTRPFVLRTRNSPGWSRTAVSEVLYRSSTPPRHVVTAHGRPDVPSVHPRLRSSRVREEPPAKARCPGPAPPKEDHIERADAARRDDNVHQAGPQEEEETEKRNNPPAGRLELATCDLTQVRPFSSRWTRSPHRAGTPGRRLLAPWAAMAPGPTSRSGAFTLEFARP